MKKGSIYIKDSNKRPAMYEGYSELDDKHSFRYMKPIFHNPMFYEVGYYQTDEQFKQDIYQELKASTYSVLYENGPKVIYL